MNPLDAVNDPLMLHAPNCLFNLRTKVLLKSRSRTSPQSPGGSQLKQYIWVKHAYFWWDRVRGGHVAVNILWRRHL